VQSWATGPTLKTLEHRWHAQRAVALHCSVDPQACPRLARPERWALSYLGTWSADRQPALEALLLAPARVRPDLAFAVARPLYPDDIDWPANVERIAHVRPADHPAFCAASRLTLNISRTDMRIAGWSPRVRLFEAAACARPIVSDRWPGLDQLFAPAREILVADTTADVPAILERTDRTGFPRALKRQKFARIFNPACAASPPPRAFRMCARHPAALPGTVRSSRPSSRGPN
jgi:spore maturation protein CgeB